MSLSKTKTVLVTGASGFIASHLIPKLMREGYNVVGVDNRTLENAEWPILNVDITDLKSLMNIPETDYLIHLAAIAAPIICRDNPKLAYDINVLGTNNILQWASSHHVKKAIFLSTAHVYGISPKYMPTPEEAPLQLNNDVYTTTKILGEYLCKMFYNNFSLPYTTFRLYNSYGPTQTTDYFIPAMIAKAKKGEIVLKGAEVTKDWIYISDTMTAITNGLKTDYVGELNIGTGIQTSLGSIAETIAKEFNAKFSLDLEQPKPTFMQADMTKTKNILNWEPTIPFEVGLKTTLDWYKSK